MDDRVGKPLKEVELRVGDVFGSLESESSGWEVLAVNAENGRFTYRKVGGTTEVDDYLLAARCWRWHIVVSAPQDLARTLYRDVEWRVGDIFGRADYPMYRWVVTGLDGDVIYLRSVHRPDEEPHSDSVDGLRSLLQVMRSDAPFQYVLFERGAQIAAPSSDLPVY